MRPLALALALSACTTAPAPERVVEWIAHGTSEPRVMVDGRRCVVLTGREVSYSQLGAMVRRCYEEQR